LGSATAISKWLSDRTRMAGLPACANVAGLKGDAAMTPTGIDASN
jgi:hypothetical protein